MPIVEKKEKRIIKDNNDRKVFVSRHVIHGLLYRLQLQLEYWNIPDWDNPTVIVNVWCLEQSYHKNTSYKNAGDLVYTGVSLKEAWDEIKTYVGKVEMPKELKSIQPFITQQV